MRVRPSLLKISNLLALPQIHSHISSMRIFSIALSAASLAIGVAAIVCNIQSQNHLQVNKLSDQQPAGTPTAAAPQATETLGEGQHWYEYYCACIVDSLLMTSHRIRTAVIANLFSHKGDNY